MPLLHVSTLTLFGLLEDEVYPLCNISHEPAKPTTCSCACIPNPRVVRAPSELKISKLLLPDVRFAGYIKSTAVWGSRLQISGFSAWLFKLVQQTAVEVPVWTQSWVRRV